MLSPRENARRARTSDGMEGENARHARTSDGMEGENARHARTSDGGGQMSNSEKESALGNLAFGAVLGKIIPDLPIPTFRYPRASAGNKSISIGFENLIQVQFKQRATLATRNSAAYNVSIKIYNSTKGNFVHYKDFLSKTLMKLWK